MIDDTSSGCGEPPPSVHPAEWVFLGMFIACLLWVAAAIYVGRTKTAPECAPTTIKSQEIRV